MQDNTTPPQRIYNKVIEELKLPHPIPEQFGITLQSITDVYLQCIDYNLTPEQAEDTILKMWKNSINIK